MKKWFFGFLFMLLSSVLVAQSTEQCKVTTKTISSEYSGECKKGLASGVGEAKGIHHYTGKFKKGMPNGKGVYSYDENTIFTGNFLDGLKEGKGEILYKLKDKDSVVKGYWSGDVYRGKRYKTYEISGGLDISNYDIIYSRSSGNILTFEISSTSGNPSMGSGVFVTDLVITSEHEKNFVKFISHFNTVNKAITKIEIGEFPVELKGRLTNGSTFELQLYKFADWTIKFYYNE